jgi:imidazole glycerol-phosphate synthase subunit HisH
MKVVLADYGAGNLRSVCSALARAGAQPVVTKDPAEVARAPLAIVAGVGHAARAVEGLGPLADVLRERVVGGRPVFGICVGLQILFEQSDEGGGEGLGLIAGRVRRLEAPTVPHMGWNELAFPRRSRILDGLEGADVYFAHSYAVQPDDDELVVARVDHAGAVVAAVQNGALAGVQFHPERSGAAGSRVLENVLQWSRSA